MVARKKKTVIEGVAERVDDAAPVKAVLVPVAVPVLTEAPPMEAIAAAYEIEPGVPSAAAWQALEAQCAGLGIAGPEDKSGYKSVVSAIGTLRKIRAAIERRRVELKKPALQYERALDKHAAELVARVDGLQAPLAARRAEIDALVAEAKAEEERKLLAARLEAERLAREEAERAEAVARAKLAAEERRRAALEAELAALRAAPPAPAAGGESAAVEAVGEVLGDVADAVVAAAGEVAEALGLGGAADQGPSDAPWDDDLVDLPDPLLLAWAFHVDRAYGEDARAAAQAAPKRFAEFRAGWMSCGQLWAEYFARLPADVRLHAPVLVRCAAEKAAAFGMLVPEGGGRG
jgi:hypothetical protein